MIVICLMVVLSVLECACADTLLTRILESPTGVQEDVRVVAVVPRFNDSGHCYIEALQEAADLINASPHLLEGAQLVLKFAESGSSPAEALWNLNKLLNTTTDQRFLHIIGPATWEPVKVVVGVGDTYRITQVVTDCVQNASVVYRKRYLFSAPQSMQAMFIAKTALIRHFNWRRIAFVYDQTDDIKAQVIVWTRSYLESLMNVSVIGSYGFQTDSLSGEIQEGLRYFETLHARIFIGLLSREGAQKIFCEIFKLKMHRMRMTWILDDFLPSNWMDEVVDGVDCTREQLAKAAEGHFWLYRLQLRDDNALLSCNLTASEVWGRIERRHGSLCDTAATYSFDALWAFAEALKYNSLNGNLINTKVLNYFFQSADDAGEGFIKIYPKLKLEGLSGYFEYSADQQRLGDMKIKYFSDGYWRDVGAYLQKNQSIFITKASMRTLFPGGVVPHDDIVHEESIEVYNLALLVVAWSLACLGVCFCVICFVVESFYGNPYYATASSPYLNYSLILGSLVTYGGVWIYGIDPRLFATAGIPRACNAFVFVMMVGFSLSYGSLLTTSWRHLQSLTRVGPPTATVFKCSLFVVVLVAVDLIIYAVWMGITPAKLTFQMLAEYIDPERDVVIQPSVARCDIRHYAPLVISIYAYKGIMVVAGFFIAFEIRHMRRLNDSHYNALAIYNVLVMSVVGVLAVSTLYNAKSYQAEYLALMACVWIGVTMTMIITFGPKFLKLYRKLRGKESAESSRRVSASRIDANPASSQRDTRGQTRCHFLAIFSDCIGTSNGPRLYKDHKPSVLSLNTTSSEITYSRGRGDSNCSYVDQYQPKMDGIECGSILSGGVIHENIYVSSPSSSGPLIGNSLSTQSANYLSSSEPGVALSTKCGPGKCNDGFEV